MKLMHWFPVIIFGGSVFAPVLFFACWSALKHLTDANLHGRNEQQQYVYQRARAARWLYDHRFHASWIAWPVLTSANAAPNSLKLPEILSQHIFTDLIHRQLLKPVQLEGNLTAYTWNLADEKAWQDVCKIPSWYTRGVSWARENMGQFITVM